MEGYYGTGDSVNRLSGLYNDTKRSTDFVIQDQNSEDPEIKALHRKLKIQKDRLVAWGAKWSNENDVAELEPLAKPGMFEIVQSVMSTIKDILDEAEPMWRSTCKPSEPQSATARAIAAAAAGDSKMPIVEFDKTHFENLIKDMQTSIDTLYDLSHARSEAGRFNTANFDPNAMSNDPTTTFESSRLRTEQIDPSTLIPLDGLRTGSVSSTSLLQDGVVLINGQAFAAISDNADPSGLPKPLLLQFTPYSPLYQHIGGPPLDPVEKLYAGLQQRTPGAFAGAWSGLPKLLGYFNDEVNMRMGLVYEFPQTFNPLRQDSDIRTPTSALHSLSDLLERRDFEPSLEIKFRLAHNIVNSIFDLHARGLAHGAVLDENVFLSALHSPANSISEIEIRKPLISSFEVFQPWSEEGGLIGAENQTNPIYRHGLDPRVTELSPLVQSNDLRALDLYSLAVMLVSIGMWTKPENLVVDGAAAIPDSVINSLAISVGTLYMKAVKTLWGAVDRTIVGKESVKDILTSVQRDVSTCLQACSTLDVADDVPPIPVRPVTKPQPRRRIGRDTRQIGRYEGKTAAERKQIEAFGRLERKKEEKRPPLPARPTADSAPVSTPAVESTSVPPAPSSKPKLRLYNQVQAPLPKEVVDTWNNVLMHQINQALKQFYKKYTETVEISLESMGHSPSKTKPTVLIVCSSVGKVKAILKRKLGDLFDDDTGMGFGLKVCSGKIVRSQFNEDDNHVPARNGGYQVCPNNGASIGAWNGDRHLPPVSFGGLVTVDDKTYGMTVHHMLDDPDDVILAPTAASSFADLGVDVDTRSSARPRPQVSRHFTDDGTFRRSSGRRKPLPVNYKPQTMGGSPASLGDRPPPPPPKESYQSHDDIPASLIPGSSAGASSNGSGSKSFFAATSQKIQQHAQRFDQSLHQHKQKLEQSIQKQRQQQLEFKQKFLQQRAEKQQRTASWTEQTLQSSYVQDDEDYEEEESELKRDIAIASVEPVLELSDSEDESVMDSDIDDCMEDSDTESLSLSNWTEDDIKHEPGDIAGIEAGFGDDLQVTQPARDDVEDGFYPCEETADEDHLDTYNLGEVYASSGIRRRTKDGMVHEIDWALFNFHENRLPPVNCFPRFTLAFQKSNVPPENATPILPREVTSMTDLPGTEVQCMARTSGLQIGQILPAIASVKLAGRISPSHSYQVAPLPTCRKPPPPPIGLPGDSGAWVIDRREGHVCGHVLAWSQRRQVAYICPMDVLLVDIALTLGASTVGLLGGKPLVCDMAVEDVGEEASRRLAQKLGGMEISG